MSLFNGRKFEIYIIDADFRIRFSAIEDHLVIPHLVANLIYAYRPMVLILCV